MSAGRIERQWRSYRAEVLPANAPTVQMVECRRAFYAGAQALRTAFLDTSDDPRTEAAELLAIEDELHQFLRDVKAGNA